MNRLKTRQKLAEPHFQAVSRMMQGKLRGHELTEPPLKIQASLKLYIDCTESSQKSYSVWREA